MAPVSKYWWRAFSNIPGLVRMLFIAYSSSQTGAVVVVVEVLVEDLEPVVEWRPLEVVSLDPE